MFSIERLRALDAVCRLGSVAAAATELHVTPSGISQPLAKLERESGHRLTEADGRGIRLTQAGLVLADHAARVLGQLAAAHTDLADLHSEILGPLRIGAVESATRTLVAPALAALREQHPRLSPNLYTGEAVVTVPMLHRGDLDMVVVESWDNQPLSFAADVTHVQILREDTYVALSTRHPLAGRDSVELAELADTGWVSCFPGTGAHDSLVHALRGVGVEPEVTCIASEYPTQLALVAANVVAAFVPPLGLTEPVPGVRLIRPRPAIGREIVAAWRTDRQRPAIRTCVAALHDVAAAVPTP
ncbi:MAG: LysR family transcriptional regulator [Streptosporangiales bacterium]|nr:LysR family transcriptional regulator [Streptosporangiales bacterium]